MKFKSVAKKIEGGMGVSARMDKGGGKERGKGDRKGGRFARVFEFKKPGTDVLVTAETEKGLKNKIKSGVKMHGLGTRLKFMNEFLAKQREKYPLSTKQTVNQFLRRMIVENPEMVFVRYIEILLGFDAGVNSTKLSDFIFEVGYLRENVMKVKEKIGANPMFAKSIRPLHDFLKVMGKVAHAAKLLLGMNKKEREEVMSGEGGDKLTSRQKAFLKLKRELIAKKERHYKLAKKKEKEMKHLDHGVEDALAKIEAEERVGEKAGNGVAEASAAKVVSFPKKGKPTAQFKKAA